MRELLLVQATTKDSLPGPLAHLLLQASCLSWTVSSIFVYEWVGGVETGEEKGR